MKLTPAELLKLIGDSFFCDETSVTPIPLTNQVLRDELCVALAKIDDDSDEKTLTNAFDLVWQARCVCDDIIIISNLDSVTFLFLAFFVNWSQFYLTLFLLVFLFLLLSLSVCKK